jgi:hypothetical protein
MIKQYSVYNANTGANVIVDTEEEAIQMFWSNLVKNAKERYGNKIYTIIEKYEDGRIKLYNQDHEELIEQPKSVEEILSFIQLATTTNDN